MKYIIYLIFFVTTCKAQDSIVQSSKINHKTIFANTPYNNIATLINKDDTLKLKSFLRSDSMIVKFISPNYKFDFLEYALLLEKVNVFKLLLDFGANPNYQKDSFSPTTFHQACQFNRSSKEMNKIYRILMQSKKCNLETSYYHRNCDTCKKHKITSLLSLCHSGNLWNFRIYMSLKPKIDTSKAYREELVRNAIGMTNYDIALDLIVKHSFPIPKYVTTKYNNKRQLVDYTPLMFLEWENYASRLDKKKKKSKILLIKTIKKLLPSQQRLLVRGQRA